MAVSGAAIASQVYSCLRGFESLGQSYTAAAPHVKAKVSAGSITDEIGRFRLWSGNVGAHKRGRSSLDYKLREASHLKSQITDLLQSLIDCLRDATAISDGERKPWEDVSDSDSGSDTSEDEFLVSKTELSQLVANMMETNTCLMRISMAIRNPAPHDQFKESKNIDMAHFEKFDVDHVQGKFPDARQYLALRLGKAISRRRQYLRYRLEHRSKLEEGLSHNSHDSDVDPLLTTNAIPSIRAQSTVASSVPSNLKTNNSLLIQDEEEDMMSQTSYTSSNNDSARLRPPPLPKDGSDGSLFECFLCHRIISASQTNLWHRHVYQDLQPYVCTFEDCPIADHTFESQHEWFTHEVSTHRKHWVCSVGCDVLFTSLDAFRLHVENTHSNLDQGRVGEIISTCERSPPSTTPSECVLCFAILPSLVLLRRHLGKHQQELALFAIPSHARGDADDDTDGGDDENSTDRSSAHSASIFVSSNRQACPVCEQYFKPDRHGKDKEWKQHIVEQHPEALGPQLVLFRVMIDQQMSANVRASLTETERATLTTRVIQTWRKFVLKRQYKSPSSPMNQKQSLSIMSSAQESDAMLTPAPIDEVPTRSLWLGEIPSATTTSAIMIIFSSFGPIESARVLSHKNCAFVTFEDLGSAVQAKSEIDGKEIFSGHLPVRVAYTKEPDQEDFVPPRKQGARELPLQILTQGDTPTAEVESPQLTKDGPSRSDDSAEDVVVDRSARTTAEDQYDRPGKHLRHPFPTET